MSEAPTLPPKDLVTCPCCEGEQIEDECCYCDGSGKVTPAQADDWTTLLPQEYL